MRSSPVRFCSVHVVHSKGHVLFVFTAIGLSVCLRQLSLNNLLLSLAYFVLFTYMFGGTCPSLSTTIYSTSYQIFEIYHPILNVLNKYLR